VLQSLVLDSSVFIQGLDPQDEAAYTVPLVVQELREGLITTRLRSMEATGRLKVLEPEQRFQDVVEGESLRMGESHTLSATDKQVLALGLQLRDEGLDPVIVSDDYSVQNMADALSLGHRGLATPGIRRRFTWTLYCPGCRREYSEPQPDDVCPVCGTGLKRKPVRKRRVTRRGGA
jgi:UPF0271 protein